MPEYGNPDLSLTSLTATPTFDYILLTEQTANIPTAANQGALYTKDDGGATELFFRSDSNGVVTQLTGLGGGAQWIDTGVYLYPAGGVTRNVAIGATSMMGSEKFLVVGDVSFFGIQYQTGSIAASGDSYGFSNIAAPSSIDASIASPAAPGNVDNGTHNYVMTYVTSGGRETDVSIASSVVTIANKTVNGKVDVIGLSASANPDVVSKNIYRDFNHDGVYKLLVNLPNATTTYLDNIANASLGALAPTSNNTGAFQIDGALNVDGSLTVNGNIVLSSNNFLTPTDDPGVFFTIPLSNSDTTTHIWAFAVGGTTIFEVQADGNGGGAATALNVASFGVFYHTGMFTATGGIVTKFSIADVSSPPTAAELTSAFGDPSILAQGFIGVLNDNNAGTAEYVVWTDGVNWFYTAGIKAL